MYKRHLFHRYINLYAQILEKISHLDLCGMSRRLLNKFGFKNNCILYVTELGLHVQKSITAPFRSKGPQVSPSSPSFNDI